MGSLPTVGRALPGPNGRAAPQQKPEHQQQADRLTKAQAPAAGTTRPARWVEVTQGRAPPLDQAQPGGSTKAPQTLHDPGQRAHLSSGPSSAEWRGQQLSRPRRRAPGEQDPRAQG